MHLLSGRMQTRLRPGFLALRPARRPYRAYSRRGLAGRPVGTNINDLQETAPQAYAARVKRGGTLNYFLDSAFRDAAMALGRQSPILAALTTDICLFHTAVGALGQGY
jgi:hypothetical protein